MFVILKPGINYIDGRFENVIIYIKILIVAQRHRMHNYRSNTPLKRFYVIKIVGLV